MKLLLAVLVYSCVLASGYSAPSAYAFSASFDQSQSSSQMTKTPGDFDVYILAMSYHNDFCLQQPSREECKTNVMVKGMTLHGLWPNRNDDPKHNYGYCDLPESKIGSNWCNADIDVKSKMSPELYDDLNRTVPGTSVCLYNHEWYAHGSCSGESVANYFEDSLKIAKSFAKLPALNKLVQDMAGQQVKRADFRTALVKDLGETGASSVMLSCRRDQKTDKTYFTQITVSLDKTHYREFPAQPSFATPPNYNGRPDDGNCPDDGISIVR